MEFPEQRQKIKEAGQGKVRNEDKARGSLCGCKHKHKHAQLFPENTAEQNTLGYFRFYYEGGRSRRKWVVCVFRGHKSCT